MLLASLIGAAALGVVRMPAYFGDGMIMQTNGEYGARAFLNGMAAPGEKVTVHAGTVYHTQADAKGTWKCENKFQPKGKCRKMRRAFRKCRRTCGLCDGGAV